MVQHASLALTALGLSLIPMQASTQLVQRSGRFLAAEHPAAGQVVLERRDSKATLVFSPEFRTTDQAPDLFVVVSPMAMPLENSPAPAYPLTPGTYSVVAPLKAINGSQRYVLPSALNASEQRSVLIWCRRYNATMSWAPLE
jgi:hypothetical protein